MFLRATLVLGFLCSLAGCGSTKMYDGPSMDRKDAAVLYIQSRPNMKFRAIDGTPVNFIHDGKVLEFRPGKHVFDVEVSTYKAYGAVSTVTYTTNFLIGSYRLELDMKPGHTYALDFFGINVDELPRQLCFQGEPHDAPGSSVNVTGEFRKMSANVKSYGCAAPQSVRRSG